MNGVDITFKELNAKANGLAHALKSLGLGKGDRVALLLPNSPTYVISYFGILKIGAIVVNINVMTHGEELIEFLKHTGAKLVITLDLFVENVLKIVKHTPVENIVIHSVFGKERELRLAEGVPQPLVFNDWIAAPAVLRALPGMLRF